MKLAAARAVEMTVGAKPCGVRPHLGNRCAIPTFPPPRRLLDCFLNSTPERSFPQPSAQASFRLILRLEKTVEISRSLRPSPRSYALIPEHVHGVTCRRARKARGHRLLRLFPTFGR